MRTDYRKPVARANYRNSTGNNRQLVLGLRVGIVAAVLLIVGLMGFAIVPANEKPVEQGDRLLALIVSTVKPEPSSELKDILELVVQASASRSLTPVQAETILGEVRRSGDLMDPVIKEFSGRTCERPTDKPCAIVESLVRDALTGSLARPVNAEIKDQLVDQLAALQSAKDSGDPDKLKAAFRAILSYFKDYAQRLDVRTSEERSMSKYMPDRKISTAATIRKMLETAQKQPATAAATTQDK